MEIIRYLALLLLGFFLTFFALLTMTERAFGHHTGQACSPNGSMKCLPLLPTAVQKDLWATKEITWCVNDRAARYPGFVAQMVEVHNDLAGRVGVTHRQVPFGTPSTTGCKQQHNMILNHQCSGCAAWTHFANWPILTEYNEALGYTDWRTTIAHESAHNFTGGHEQYDDARFVSHLRTYGYWATDGAPGRVGSPTVLDFGTGQSLFTDWDLRIFCEVNDRLAQRFTGCGFQQQPPCVPAPGAPCWNGEGFAFSDGWYFIPNDNCGNWWDNKGNHAYGWCPPDWNGRLIPFKGTYEFRGGSFYDIAAGQWYTVP